MSKKKSKVQKTSPKKVQTNKNHDKQAKNKDNSQNNNSLDGKFAKNENLNIQEDPKTANLTTEKSKNIEQSPLISTTEEKITVNCEFSNEKENKTIHSNNLAEEIDELNIKSDEEHSDMPNVYNEKVENVFKVKIYQQSDLLQTFEDPLEFIRAYSDIYEQQVTKPRKVLFDSLETKNDFETRFLTLLHSGCLEKGQEIENILKKMQERTYFDEKFYNYIRKMYLKNVAILIDQAESNIARILKKPIIDEQDLFVESIMILYRYTDLDIDVNLLFLEKITKNFERFLKNPVQLTNRVLKYQETLTELNKKLQTLEISNFIFDDFLQSKIDLSLNIRGIKRRNGYDSDFVILFINELKFFILNLEKSTAFLYVMNVKNEMNTRGLNYPCLDELVKMAENLI